MDEKKHELMFEKGKAVVGEYTGYALKLAIVVVFAVASWRIAWASVNVDLSKFDFSDLLAMILAIFAIAMSVAFYFKSTDSSNQFYDNSYNFTQRTSEILGRIEERFGERLKHLDEGWGRMETRLGARTSDEIQKRVKEEEGKEVEVKKDLEKVLAEREQLIKQLSERAYQQETERASVIGRMTDLEKRREDVEAKIHAIEADRDRLQKRLRLAERRAHSSRPDWLREVVMMMSLQTRDVLMHVADTAEIRDRLGGFFARLPADMLSQLRCDGILDDAFELTPLGVDAIRSEISRARRHDAGRE